jgi:hypothetical protein
LNKAKQIKRERIVKDPMRAKYFHFNNNYRPPYYGTWRKISKIITGRRPFALSHQVTKSFLMQFLNLFINLGIAL